MELFAGSGSWSKALQKLGWSADLMDIKYDDSHDILQPGMCAQLCARVRARAYQAVHLGTECTTWSRAAHPAYRTNGHILGLPGLSPDKQALVDAANRMVECSVDVLLAADAANVACTLENPYSSMLFLHPRVRGLLQSGQFVRVRTDYCCWGARCMKPTAILGNRAYLEDLGRQCKNRRPHKHGLYLRGNVQFRGKWVKATTLGNRYPLKLANAWAALVDKHERRHP